ncbi:MAG: restriction endonuclease subunit S [Mangrovibacterium sp.]
MEEIGFASTCMETIKDAVFAGFLIRFRPKKNLLSTKFSKFYFRATIHRAYFVKEVDLVTRVSLGQDLLKSFPVLLPPMKEQETIAEFLEQELYIRDEYILKAQVEIEKAKEYQESLITQIVTGQLKVPEKARANLER